MLQGENEMNYKISKYNYYVKYEDKIIFFNSLSQSLFYVESKKYKNFDFCKNNIILLGKKYPELFDKMINMRFIVTEDFKETDLIFFRNKRDVYLNNIYFLTIIPNLSCNFDCWYCYENKEKCLLAKHYNFQFEDVIKE